jgi:hypothetical protein
MMRGLEEDAWTEQALRLYRRYDLEIVAALNLCPWAEKARLEGRVREYVLLQTDDASVEPSVLALRDADSARDAPTAAPEADVALLIYPRLQIGRVDFDDFAARIRDAEASRHELGRVPFVSAVFHPHATPDRSQPERLIPFLRRTPDPTIQFVRASILERVRERAPQGTHFVDLASLDASASNKGDATPLRERIARSNLATVGRIGIAELTRRLDEIQRDRDASYGALAMDSRLCAP